MLLYTRTTLSFGTLLRTTRNLRFLLSVYGKDPVNQPELYSIEY